MTSLLPRILKPTTGRGKKIALLAAILLLPIGVMGAVYSNGTEIEEPNRLKGSDAGDLVGPRPTTGFSVFGSVNINGKFPLGTGVVIAYDELKTQAVASSPLDRFGKYKLTDVPPGKLILLVKRKVTFKPSEYYQNAVGGLGIETDQHTAHSKVGVDEKLDGFEEIQILSAKQPKKSDLEKVHFDVFSPGIASQPAVQWLIDMAFCKYGHFSDPPAFVVPAGEGDRSLVLNLKVH